MTFATNMRNVANKLLTTYGTDVTITRIGGGTYDPATSNVINDTTFEFSGKGHPSPYTDTEIASGVIDTGDVRMILYSVEAPMVGDIAEFDDRAYRVMDVAKTVAQGSDIVYTLRLRI